MNKTPRLDEAMRHVLIAFCGFLSACASTPGPASSALSNRIASIMSPLTTDGASVGLMVADADSGEVLLENNARARFLPASTVKLVTTAAAYHVMGDLDEPDMRGQTRLYLSRGPDKETPDLVLAGSGDARLADHPDCAQNCLSALADAVVDAGIFAVGEVIGDATAFDQTPWPDGWSWEDTQFGYGAAVSALNVNDNVVWLEIAPDPREGQPARLSWADGSNYFALDNRITTVEATGASSLDIERLPGERWLRLSGSIPAGAPPRKVKLGVDDPAHLAAWRLALLLQARGVSIGHGVRVLHGNDRSPKPDQERLQIAALTPAPLSEDIAIINKNSQNMHSEALLMRTGLESNTPSLTGGIRAVESMLGSTGTPRSGFDLRDGSGMSIYNRLSPQTLVNLLVWANDQDWGEDWRKSFAIAGQDGTLRRRFVSTPLNGHLVAKTGTLNGTNALAGYMTAASGRDLAFSVFVNDRASVSGSALDEIEAALVEVAASF